MSEKEIAHYLKREFKAIVKKHVTSSAFKSLKFKQLGHIKIKHIKYQNNKVKPYLRSNLFSSEESATLFNLRSNTVNGYKCASQVFIEMISFVNCDVLMMIQLIIYILV